MYSGKKFFAKYFYLLLTSAWLITIGFIIDTYWSANANLKSAQKAISEELNKQENDFSTFCLTFKNARSAEKLGIDFALKKTEQKSYFIFAYSFKDSIGYELLQWNTNIVVPDSTILNIPDDMGFSLLSNGYYAWKKQQVGDFWMVALFPVKWNFFVENNYLKNEFCNSEILASEYEVQLNHETGLQIRSAEGRPLFKIIQKASQTFDKRNLFAIVLISVAMILLLIYAHLLAIFISNRYVPWAGLLSLIISFLLIKYIGIRLKLPFDPKQFSLFDPSNFKNTLYYNSIGDVLINLLLLTWLSFYFHGKVSKQKFFRKTSLNKIQSIVAQFFIALILVAISFFYGDILYSLVTNTSISFDVTNFFTITPFTLAGFIVVVILTVIYYVLCKSLYKISVSVSTTSTWNILIFSVILSLIYLTIRIGHLRGGYDLYILLCMSLFLLLMQTKLSEFMTDGLISSKMLIWIAFFCVSISLFLKTENDKKEITERKKFAEILAMRSDPANEVLIKSMLADFREDFILKQMPRFSDLKQHKILEDSIISKNASGYTNKYDTRIYFFDNENRPICNEDSVSFSVLNSIINTESSPTGIPGLYTYSRSFDELTYIYQKTIRDTSGRPQVTLFILADPQKQKRDALAPELFGKQLNTIENSPLYSIAIYNDSKLINSFNDYPFPSRINDLNLSGDRFREIRRAGYSELWYYPGADKVVSIVRSKNSTIEFITIFSYLFSAFLLITSLFWLLNSVVVSQVQSKSIFSFWRMSIKNQIHGSIIVISVISFLVIGAASVYFFFNRFETNNREKLSRTIKIIEKQVKTSLLGLQFKEDSAMKSDDSWKKQFDDDIDNISEIHGIDINIFNPQGKLVASSLELPYAKGIISGYMNPLAYFHLAQKNEIQFFQNEKIGKLNYISNYIPISDKEGKLFAYLNLPFYSSQNLLKQEISNFLVVIINLNAFIFILAGIVSLFITNRISNIFYLIGEKMKVMRLGSKNEQIVWERDDEIGALINQYNKMVQKLEESASALAISEREGAWKEMARQVAHEIKNPLTPMKLSLQYLQKSIENKSPDLEAMIKNVSNTLIEQIDHLSSIANAFSQFASIGETDKIKMDLNETLRNVISLFEWNPNLKMLVQLESTPVWIKADKTQINRLFTNLITNAIQSVPSDRTPRLIITQSVTDKAVTTIIKDNGTGISDDIKEKIFTPNFTTKSSGTGLGLAMCKRIVERTEGEIGFDTEIGVGTTFYISLPLCNDQVI